MPADVPLERRVRSVARGTAPRTLLADAVLHANLLPWMKRSADATEQYGVNLTEEIPRIPRQNICRQML